MDTKSQNIRLPIIYIFMATYTKIKKSQKLSDFPPNRPQSHATTKKKVRHKVGIKVIK